MKIYNKVVIDIETNEILYEDSFEYEGEIAHCGGGSEPSVQYQQSPEQRQMYQTFMPLMQKIGQAQQPLWNIPPAPQAPQMPSMSGVLSGVSPEYIMPSEKWWDMISPNVKEGLWAPWNEAANQMMETMGAGGQLGSARGGYSGTGERALGELYSRAGEDVGMQAWKMTAPGMMTGYQNILQERSADYQNYMDMLNRDYSAAMTGWGGAMEREKFPYTVIPAMMGGTYSSPIVDPGGPGFGQTVGSGLMAGAMPAMMGANPLLGIPLGVGAMLGGK